MTPEKTNNITGIILAGGKSSRMGQDKGLKIHDGIPFIQHILKAMNLVTNEILIVTDNVRYKTFGYPCVSDMIPNKGPVGGIYTGLTYTKTSLNLVLSCDIPFITAPVLENLIADYDPNYDAIMYEDNPLIGLYHSATKGRFFESIQNNDLGLRKTLSQYGNKSFIFWYDCRSNGSRRRNYFFTICMYDTSVRTAAKTEIQKLTTAFI